MPGDLPPGYASHYTSEYVNEKGDWDCRPSAPNHLWDCGVLNACAAELIQVRFWQQKKAAAAPKKKPPSQTSVPLW
jgi:hypothetical protein